MNWVFPSIQATSQLQQIGWDAHKIIQNNWKNSAYKPQYLLHDESLFCLPFHCFQKYVNTLGFLWGLRVFWRKCPVMSWFWFYNTCHTPLSTHFVYSMLFQSPTVFAVLPPLLVGTLFSHTHLAILLLVYRLYLQKKKKIATYVVVYYTNTG